jgi:hypothetical protein
MYPREGSARVGLPDCRDFPGQASNLTILVSLAADRRYKREAKTVPCLECRTETWGQNLGVLGPKP